MGVDVAIGVALLAGGLTTAVLAHIFGRHYYEPITRLALLKAALGYTFVILGLLVDIVFETIIASSSFKLNSPQRNKFFLYEIQGKRCGTFN